MRKCIFVVLCWGFALCLSAPAIAVEAWTRVDGIKESDIKEVAVDRDDDEVVYASSEKKLYRTEDRGKTWRSVFSARGDGNVINFVDVYKGEGFVCTDRGVYKSASGASGWNRVFKGVGVGENSVRHIGFSQDKIYVGTKAGLFTGDDDTGYVKSKEDAGNVSVRWIAFLDEDVFLAAETGVYRGREGNWKRVFVTATEESEYDTSETDDASSAIRPVNSIFIRQDSVYLATDKGIFTSEDKGETWKEFTSSGLLSKKVKRLLVLDSPPQADRSNDILYAATDNGVFVFDSEARTWKAIYKGMSADRTSGMIKDSKGRIWVAANKGLYKEIALSRNFVTPNDVTEFFNHEPTIREMQEAAIKYAEVHPEKIEKWRSAAKQKALLPDVSVGIDRYVTDYYHWDAGQNPDVLQKGNDVVSWDVTMSWDLGDLIWTSDQTSIDTRSRLMVQLRDDILDEITRTYFERRRLQIEAQLSPSHELMEGLEQELRIQELTADLDALTGGYFSLQLAQNE